MMNEHPTITALRATAPHKLSPLPWRVDDDGVSLDAVLCSTGLAVSIGSYDKDASHIAAAVNAAPVLLAELDALRAQVQAQWGWTNRKAARGQAACCWCAQPLDGRFVGAGDGSRTGSDGAFACSVCAHMHGLLEMPDAPMAAFGAANLRGAMDAQQERDDAAAVKAGIAPQGCDTADELADEVIALRAQLAAAQRPAQRPIPTTPIGVTAPMPAPSDTCASVVERQLRAQLAAARACVGAMILHVIDPDCVGSRADRYLRDTLIHHGFLSRDVMCPDGVRRLVVTEKGRLCVPADELEGYDV